MEAPLLIMVLPVVRCLVDNLDNRQPARVHGSARESYSLCNLTVAIGGRQIALAQTRGISQHRR
jgi:hypothetical protein